MLVEPLLHVSALLIPYQASKRYVNMTHILHSRWPISLQNSYFNCCHGSARKDFCTETSSPQVSWCALTALILVFIFASPCWTCFPWGKYQT